MSTTPPAGWFPDPERPGTLRYWDGMQWTDNRHDGHPAAATSGLFAQTIAEPTAVRAPAPAGARVGAYLIDLLVYIGPALLAGLLAYAAVGDEIADDGSDDPLRYYEWWAVGTLFVVGPLYALTVSLVYRGQSLGKRLLGLRVVTSVHQQPLGRGRAFLRECLAKPFLANPGLLGLVSLFMIAASQDRRGLHDHVMGTQVIRGGGPDSTSPLDVSSYQPATAVTPTTVASGSAAEAFGSSSGGTDAFGNPL